MRSVRDLLVAANGNHVVSLENISVLSDAMQDALCSVLTGSGVGGRQFYTNADEHVFGVKRPVIVNGVAMAVTRPDLAERFVCIEFGDLQTGRRLARDINREVEAIRAPAFSALLDVFHAALKLEPQIIAEEHQPPRMADFAVLGEAVARVMGRSPGWFLREYAKRRQGDAASSIEATKLGRAIVDLMHAKEPIVGIFDVLNRIIRDHAADKMGGVQRSDDWPSSGRAFGDQLRRLTAPMRQLGIQIEILKRNKSGTRCRISVASS